MDEQAYKELKKGGFMRQIQNLPRSLKNEKHKISSVTNNDDGTYTIKVIKGGLIER